jgi:hypothetical protein
MFKRGTKKNGEFLSPHECEGRPKQWIADAGWTSKICKFEFTAEVRLRSQFSLCGLCGGNSDTILQFSRASISLSPGERPVPQGTVSFIGIDKNRRSHVYGTSSSPSLMNKY